MDKPLPQGCFDPSREKKSEKLSRIELLRVSSNQVRQQIYDMRDLAMMQLNEALEDRQNEG